MTATQVQAQRGAAFAFTGEIPKKIGVGGGRRSDFLDAVREALASGKGYSEPVEIGEGETFSDGAKRITSRIYRKGAIPTPFLVRTDPAKGVVMIIPKVAGNDNAGTANQPAVAARPAAQAMAVQLPTPKAGETLEVSIAGQPPIMVSHKNAPAPTVEAPKRGRGRPKRNK